MFGGNIPPTPTIETGDGFRRSGTHETDRLKEKRKKILIDDKEIINFLKIWLDANN